MPKLPTPAHLAAVLANVLVAVAVALGLILALHSCEPKPCYVPDELSVGSMKLSDICGPLPSKPLEDVE